MYIFQIYKKYDFKKNCYIEVKSMDRTTTIRIRVVIAATLAASMVFAGTSLATFQQHGYAATQTKKQAQNTVQSLCRCCIDKDSKSQSQERMEAIYGQSTRIYPFIS